MHAKGEHMSRAYTALKALVEAEADFDQNRADCLMNAAKVWAEARAAVAEGETIVADLQATLTQVRDALGCQPGFDVVVVARQLKEHSQAYLLFRRECEYIAQNVAALAMKLDKASRR
jgi:hypothetical protein